jgi:hypothetical protein
MEIERAINNFCPQANAIFVRKYVVTFSRLLQLCSIYLCFQRRGCLLSIWKSAGLRDRETTTPKVKVFTEFRAVLRSEWHRGVGPARDKLLSLVMFRSS